MIYPPVNIITLLNIPMCKHIVVPLNTYPLRRHTHIHWCQIQSSDCHKTLFPIGIFKANLKIAVHSEEDILNVLGDFNTLIDEFRNMDIDENYNYNYDNNNNDSYNIDDDENSLFSLLLP
jgi:hypothetical protein